MARRTFREFKHAFSSVGELRQAVRDFDDEAMDFAVERLTIRVINTSDALLEAYCLLALETYDPRTAERAWKRAWKVREQTEEILYVASSQASKDDIERRCAERDRDPIGNGYWWRLVPGGWALLKRRDQPFHRLSLL